MQSLLRSAARPWVRTLLSAATLVVLSATAQAQTILRWGDVVGGSHPQVQMIDRVAADVKTRTAGRVEIQSFANGQLGSSRDMIEAVSNGSQQLVTEGGANFGAWIPAISVIGRLPTFCQGRLATIRMTSSRRKAWRTLTAVTRWPT